MKNGYLYRRGWQESLIEKKIIDQKGEPLPWLSYPAIDFLKYYLPVDACVFEYGAGYSTNFYARNYQRVVSVEDNHEWYQKVQSSIVGLQNALVSLARNKEEFVNAIEKTETKFDLVVVDGSWRNECVLKGLEYLNENGILVIDDADRKEYETAIEVVRSKGFLAIPFVGMSALSYEDHTTMVLFKYNLDKGRA